MLVVSDIHADTGSLEAILRTVANREFVKRYGKTTKILSLGDCVERGYHPCEVIDRLKGIDNLISVLGNHDEAFVNEEYVSGNDDRSVEAHKKCRARGGWNEFFSGMRDHYVDNRLRLYCCHGGPVDPRIVCPPDADPVGRWLHSRTWQRISDLGTRYLDGSGYHYLPEDAFAAVRPLLEEDFLILCGHEHEEAAFVERDGKVQDEYLAMERLHFECLGRRIEEKRLFLGHGINALVRVGTAGPEAYCHYFGMDKTCFGVLHEAEGQRYISMLNFRLDRDCMPE